MKELKLTQLDAVNGGAVKITGSASNDGWSVGIEISF